MSIFQRIRWWIANQYKIESRCGDIFLNTSALCCIGVMFSIGLNMVVKAANGSQMPVVSKAGTVYGMDNGHIFSNDETVLKFLGDWIEINGDEFLSLKETLFSHIAAVLHFPIGVDIVASPGDVGMWIFAAGGLLTAFLSIMSACRSWIINKYE